MNRKSGIAAGIAALDDTELFEVVHKGAQRTYDRSPFAVVAGQSTLFQLDTRSRHYSMPHEFIAVLGILSGPGDEGAVEDQMADLVDASIEALRAAGFTPIRSDGNSGLFLPLLDGRPVREERILFGIDDDRDD
jgi:hypothetical protein